MMGAVVAWFNTLFGFVGLIGLIGDAGLFRFVDVILQVLYISNQVVQVGEPYGSEQIEVLCSWDNPSKPGEHVSCLVSTDSIHVGGSGVQLLEVVVQPVELKSLLKFDWLQLQGFIYYAALKIDRTACYWAVSATTFDLLALLAPPISMAVNRRHIKWLLFT
jgi:hypothetical protein